jgi:hypothetical protein
MGYDVRIIRGEDPSGNLSHRITVEEWVDYVESDTRIFVSQKRGNLTTNRT